MGANPSSILPPPPPPPRFRTDNRRRGIALLKLWPPLASSPVPGGAPAAAATFLPPSLPSPSSLSPLPAAAAAGRAAESGESPGAAAGPQGAGLSLSLSPSPLFGDHGMLHRALHPHFPLHFAAGKCRRSRGVEVGIRCGLPGMGRTKAFPLLSTSVVVAPGLVKAPVLPQLRLGGKRWRDVRLRSGKGFAARGGGGGGFRGV